MKHRKAKKAAHQPQLKLVGKHETQALAACFAGQDQVLLPLLELVQDARASIDQLMNDAASHSSWQYSIAGEREMKKKLHELHCMYSRDATTLRHADTAPRLSSEAKRGVTRLVRQAAPMKEPRVEIKVCNNTGRGRT